MENTENENLHPGSEPVSEHFTSSEAMVTDSQEITIDQVEEQINMEYIASSGGKRFANYLIDVVFMYLLIIILGLIVAVITVASNPESVDTFENLEDPGNKVMEYLIGIAIVVTYFTFLEFATGGRSVGKMLTGSKVVDEYGNKPTLKMCFIRSLCRLIPFEAFSFLGSRRGLHDSIADTYVVDVKKLPAEKR